MATNEHDVVKQQKIANTAVGVLEQELLIPNLFQKEGIDQFKGAEDDTVSVKVEGVLPFHDYEWRSGSASSSTPGVRQKVTFDLYKERKIAVTFGGSKYQGVAVTDEQFTMDIEGWAKLNKPQVKAVARGLGREAVTTLTNQSYNVVIGDAEANLRGAIIEARRVLNAFNAPTDNRYLLVGSDFEAALLDDPSLNLAQNVGDSEAESALAEAKISRKYGFNIVVDQTIPADAAYAFAGSGFIFLNAAPAVPGSVKMGSTAALDGVTMRWIVDYDPEHFTDRSIVNTYYGFRSVEDVLLGWNEADKTEVVSLKEHFVRGVKLTLDGASTYPSKPTGADWDDQASWTAAEELAMFSNITGPGKHLLGTATGTVAND